MRQDQEHHAIIVGSGVSGGRALKELTGTGLRVRVESPGRFDRSIEYEPGESARAPHA